MERKNRAITMDTVFPLLGVMEGIIISMAGDMTVGWDITLPCEHSMTPQQYEDIIHSMQNAIKILPPWAMIHRQDIYTEDEYKGNSRSGFLSQSYSRHFQGRKYLTHRQRIYLTLSTRSSVMRSVHSSSIIAGAPFPTLSAGDYSRRAWNLESLSGEFESILSSKTGFGMERMDTASLKRSIKEYLTLFDPDMIFSDITPAGDGLSIRDSKVWSFSFSESEDLPGNLPTSDRDSSVNANAKSIHLSTGSALGSRLRCEHVANTYILTVPRKEILSSLTGRRKRMLSMSEETENAMFGDEIEEFVKNATVGNHTAIRMHANVIVWGKEHDYLDIKGKVGSALQWAGLNCSQNTSDTDVIWSAGIPGAACELGSENMMLGELCSGLCLGINETFAKGLPGGNLPLCDRTRHIPVDIDLHETAASLGLIDNMNAFILGGSGTGKSFFTNYMVRNMYDSGEKVVIIDVGDSYEGLCSVINEESGGRDGIYYTWDMENPISFDAFQGWRDWTTDDGKLRNDDPSLIFLKSILKTLSSPAGGWNESTNPILEQIIMDFIKDQRNRLMEPTFDDLHVFLYTDIKPKMESKEGYMCCNTSVTGEQFRIDDMIRATGRYSQEGVYSFLLNNKSPQDITDSRFTVFEVGKIKGGDETFYSLCILCIMNLFNSMMRSQSGAKTIVIEEAWTAIATESMSAFLNELWKTSRKHNTSAMVVTQQISDILNSSVIKDTILQNSSVRILLEQTNNLGSLDQLSEVLGLDEHQKELVKSIGHGANYREVFISLGSKFSGVFATEVSPEEAIAYESKKDRKADFLRYKKEMGPISAIRKITTRRK